MPNLELTIACWDYDRTRPLMDGRVQPEGITPNIKVLRPREIFPRMLQHQEFHASEMSLASYVILKARGQCPFVAIPVMLSKMFRHDCIYVRTDAGINEPADLRGKRIGVAQYSSTPTPAPTIDRPKPTPTTTPDIDATTESGWATIEANPIPTQTPTPILQPQAFFERFP